VAIAGDRQVPGAVLADFHGSRFAITAHGLGCSRKDREMKHLLALPLLLVLTNTGAALAQDTRFNFDKDANFATFKTYQWVTMKDAAKAGELMDRQIKSTVDAELSKKGLARVEGDQKADLLLGYQAGIDQEKSFTSFDSGWGYGPGWYGGGWYGGGGGITTGQTSTIYIGQLALDFYAAAPKTLVWRGVVSKTLDTNAKPEKQQKNLTKSVTKLLKNFPPPVKK
jgi:uncharacterized protein DUF4136